MFTCPNPSCGRTFDIPLKTLNLQDSSGPYPACPFCLTRIADQAEKGKNLNQGESHSRERASKSKERPSSCPYHLGYLSERGDKQQIPDDCIVCRDLLNCMLQKVKA